MQTMENTPLPKQQIICARTVILKQILADCIIKLPTFNYGAIQTRLFPDCIKNAGLMDTVTNEMLPHCVACAKLLTQARACHDSMCIIKYKMSSDITNNDSIRP